jgi:hypothetical protein
MPPNHGGFNQVVSAGAMLLDLEDRTLQPLGAAACLSVQVKSISRGSRSQGREMLKSTQPEQRQGSSRTQRAKAADLEF